MKINLLLPFLALALSTSAQTTIQLIDYASGATIAANATVYVKSIAEDEVKSFFDFKNVSNSAQGYKIKRHDILLNGSGALKATALFCFAGGCYLESTLLSPNALTLAANQLASQGGGTADMLTAELREHSSVVGLSIVKYTIFNIANANDSIQFTIRYSDPVWLSVKDQPEFVSQTDVVPNPATSGFTVLKFTSSSTFDGKLNIINSIGQVVHQKEVEVSVGANKIQLETSGLPAGIYFVKLESTEESITKRLIIH